MTPEQDLPSREQQLNEILAAYLEAERAGRAPAQQQRLEQQPQYSADLRSSLVDRAHSEKLAGPPDTAILPPPLDSQVAPTIAPGATLPAAGTAVRYFGDYELLEE